MENLRLEEKLDALLASHARLEVALTSFVAAQQTRNAHQDKSIEDFYTDKWEPLVKEIDDIESRVRHVENEQGVWGERWKWLFAAMSIASSVGGGTIVVLAEWFLSGLKR